MRKFPIVVCTFVLGALAHAGQVNLPINVSGGNHSQYKALGNSGAIVAGQGAMGINDGVLGFHQSDAYDGFGGFAVDGVGFNAPGGVVTANGNLITAGPVVLSGMNVNVQFYFDPNTATVRFLAIFNNPTGADISSVIAWGGELGSDSNTIVRATSDGDTVLTIADRWSISTQLSVEAPTDPVSTFVFGGPGTPAVTLNSIVNNLSATSDKLDVRYNLTVPAGQTRSLLLFAQMNSTLTSAQNAVATFDSTTALLNGGFLAGLTQADLAQVANWDFSALTIGNVESFIWNDLNGNGVQDAGEPGIFGVNVRLLDSNGATVQRTKSDESGIARFAVPAGTYVLSVDRPSGFKFSAKDQGADDAVDSDVATTDGRSGSLAVTAGALSDTADAGLVEIEQVAYGSDLQRLYRVYSASGLFSVLANSGGRSITGLAMDPTSGTLFAVTDGTGTNANTLFTVDKSTGALTMVGALSANAPILDIAFNPSGQLFGFSQNSTNLCTIDKATGTVASFGKSGVINSGTALGFGLGNIGSTLYASPEGPAGKLYSLDSATGNQQSFVQMDGPSFSVSQDSIYISALASDATGRLFGISSFDGDGSSSALIQIDTTSGHVTTVGDLPAFFESLAFDVTPGSLRATIGDKVWTDSNGNGILDNGEKGLSGVTVNLLDTDGVIQSTTTDSNGVYGFNVPAGTYTVQFVLPDGLDFSPANRGADDAVDSDADISTGKTTTITLAAGDAVSNVDAGMLTPVKPTVTSAAGASSNNVFLGESIDFSVAATDANGNPLTITWDFGDGTTGSGASVSHTYTTPGVFVATATITNGTLGGTTKSSSVVSISARPITISKVGVKLNFSKPGTDAVSFSGILQLPAGSQVASQSAIVNFGGVTKTFTLDAKGGAKSAKDSIKIGIKGTAAQNAKFAVKLTGDFASALADEGFNNAENKSKPVQVAISLSVGGKLFATTTQMFYTSKAQKGGSAKALRLK